MSGSTSVPRISFGDRGAIAPQESAVITGLAADWNAAAGGNLNTTSKTNAAGQLIASQAAIIGDANDQELFLFNNVDPAYASGRMQDGIARIYFLERDPALPTILQIVCGGAVNVIIPIGASIKDTASNIYFCIQQGQIGAGGTVTLSFSAQLGGPTAVPPSNGVQIYQAINGWNTATVASGVVGNLVESRAAFEQRRQATIAANGAGFLPAISGRVGKVAGVIDWYATENSTGSPVTVRGVTLDANSLYVCVAGGAAADIAKAIWTKKNPGCAYTGNTPVVVQDTNSGYSPPYPSYTVTYETPTAAPVSFLVTITNSSAVPNDALAQIAAAINAAFLGQDGGPRARIGSTIYASRFYAGISLLGAWAQIISVLIGVDTVPDATFTGSIAGITLTVSGVTGTIAIGQFVYGPNVQPGTIITAGAGSSWNVSVSQSAASATSSVAADELDIATNINWVPTFASGAGGTQPDVSLVLI